MNIVLQPFGSGEEVRHPPKLLTPGRIGGLELKNRIIMAPMTTRGASEDGFVTEDTIAYYCERAEGGVGLITVEMASPEKAGKHRDFELGIYDDRFLPGLSRLVDALHERGAKASIQLGHGGGHTRLDVTGGEPPVAPSAIPHVVHERVTEIVIPEAMTIARIEAAIEAFAQAAARAQRAGFDAIEIHAAHGYLISQFLAPAENIREDEYGGSLENRARLGLQIIARIKRHAPGLPVIFRLSADDFFPGGITPDESRQVAIWAAKAGADAIHVAAGHYRSVPSSAGMIPSMSAPDATFLAFATQIKPHVDVPVITVGRLGEPGLALGAIERGDADFVAMARPLLADPAWVEHVACGEPVRMCIACNTCVDGMRDGAKLACLVNPVVGGERRYGACAVRREKLPSGLKIAVVGAGPAGLSYVSLVGARNRVTVFERIDRSGGAFLLAGLAPKFQGANADPASLIRYVTYLEQRCRLAGVNFVFRTDVAARPEILEGFDLVVLATGAAYRTGLGLVPMLLRAGTARLPFIRSFAADSRFRDWFYYRARVSRVSGLAARLSRNCKVIVIGDALKPGKSQAAIRSAFDAAYGMESRNAS